MSFITRITAGITDIPKEGQTAQEAREEAVRNGVLPPEQAPNVTPPAPDQPSESD